MVPGCVCCCGRDSEGEDVFERECSMLLLRGSEESRGGCETNESGSVGNDD